MKSRRSCKCWQREKSHHGVKSRIRVRASSNQVLQPHLIAMFCLKRLIENKLQKRGF